MPTDHRSELAAIKRFDQLVRYRRNSMGWPINGDDFEELTFEYSPEELGIDRKNAAKIQEIKRLRPLDPEMRFIGLSLAMYNKQPEYFWHFLDPANHEDGVPLDAISYHLYTCPDIVNPRGLEGNAPPEHWPGIHFAQGMKDVEFYRDIRPILANTCFQCHGPDAKQRKGKLRLEGKEYIVRDGDIVHIRSSL